MVKSFTTRTHYAWVGSHNGIRRVMGNIFIYDSPKSRILVHHDDLFQTTSAHSTHSTHSTKEKRITEWHTKYDSLDILFTNDSERIIYIIRNNIPIGWCKQCGYHLDMHSLHWCPECGQRNSLQYRSRFQQQRK